MGFGIAFLCVNLFFAHRLTIQHFGIQRPSKAPAMARSMITAIVQFLSGAVSHTGFRIGFISCHPGKKLWLESCSINEILEFMITMNYHV